jgi:transposase-like protein
LQEVAVDHTTLYRWTQRYAPELETAWYRSRLSFSWRVDETYIRVKGRWEYLYRAIDKGGATLDFYLADRRNAKAAKRFLANAGFGEVRAKIALIDHSAFVNAGATVAIPFAWDTFEDGYALEVTGIDCR